MKSVCLSNKLRCQLFSGILLVIAIFYSGPLWAATGELALSAGYRTDRLDWNIASDFSGSTPNVLSELSWDDLQILQLGAEAEIVRPIRDRLSTVLLGRASYGWILSGNNRDSDYGGDNRTLEWSRSDNDAGDGHVLDLEGGVGFRYELVDKNWSLMPQVGYAYYEQSLVMQDGYQTLSEPTLAPPPYVPSPIGPIAGLDSTYLAWWFGPWLGLQADYRQGDRLSFDFSVRWHKVDFRAEANWNLRTDLAHPVSFEHQADGDGFSLAAGIRYELDAQWSLDADLSSYDLQADDGIDLVYDSSGGVGGTSLNEVNWESWSLALALRYRF